METIEIGEKEYKVKIAKTEEEKQKGLQGVKELPDNEGMLFIYDKPQTVGFWMKDTEIPLDIIFINEDYEVISIYQGQPNDETIVEEDNVQFVLELNQNSGVKEGDELEFENEESDLPVMKVIAPDGSTQMELQGGERIVSRRETIVLIRKAKKAEKYSNTDNANKYYKQLGKYMFKVLDNQDNREPEYVTKKD